MLENITENEARTLARQNRLKRFNSNAMLEEDLPAPQVNNLISPDNLVPSEAEISGLNISIPEWSRVLPNDKIYLLVQGEQTEIFHVVLDPEKEKFPIVLNTPTSLFPSNRSYVISYAIAAQSGSTSYSAPVTIKIDRESPNQGNMPDALIYPEEIIAKGLTLEYLTAHNEFLIATVPAYTKMEAGQTVNPVWADNDLPAVTVTDADVKAGKIAVSISSEIIKAAGEGVIQSHYSLTSRAGYDGLPSDPSLVSVILTPVPTNLLAPTVPLAADGLIDLPDVDSGVAIEIPEYSNAINGDIIYAKWGNTTLTKITVSEGKFPMEILVPRYIIIAEGSGSITISYQVDRKGRVYESPVTKVLVDVDHAGPDNPDESDPVNKALGAVIKGSSSTVNALEPDDLGKDAYVTVPFYNEAKVGEVITVYWGTGSQEKS